MTNMSDQCVVKRSLSLLFCCYKKMGYNHSVSDGIQSFSFRKILCSLLSGYSPYSDCQTSKIYIFIHTQVKAVHHSITTILWYSILLK